MVNMGPGAITPDNEVTITVPNAASIKALEENDISLYLIIASMIIMNPA